ncbi:MAG: hypothetical protein MI724_04700 [Spirochaetales bacterium]|nr:hypothetical protein [Spirochaetales bacterium]
MSSPTPDVEMVDLPGKYLLTESGIQYCARRQIPLRELRTRQGNRGSGIVWRRYDPENVKRFVAYELLDEIEIERTEFLTRRSAIMAVTRQTVIGMLEKRFRPELKQRIRESSAFELIKDRVAETSPVHMQDYLKKNERSIRVLRHSLLLEPVTEIRKDGDMREDERAERVDLIRKIIGAIDGETWFLLSVLPDARARQRLMRSIQELVLMYTNRFRIADYIALMLMELLEYAERTQILNFAERDQYIRTHPHELASRLARPEFRDKLFQRAAASNSLLSLNYRFSGNPYNPQRGPQMQVTVTNKGLVGYESRRQIITKRDRNVRRVPLAHFYQTENPTQLDTTLGTYYLSYVEQACSEVGLRFGADMQRDERREETSTQMRLAI